MINKDIELEIGMTVIYNPKEGVGEIGIPRVPLRVRKGAKGIITEVFNSPFNYTVTIDITEHIAFEIILLGSFIKEQFDLEEK